VEQVFNLLRQGIKFVRTSYRRDVPVWADEQHFTGMLPDNLVKPVIEEPQPRTT
jgi:hypothetical protein